MSTSIQSEIEATLDEHDVAFDEDDIADEIEGYAEYNVPEDELRVAILSKYDVPQDAQFAPSESEDEVVALAELSEVDDEQAVTVEAEVVKVRGLNHENMVANAVLADKTGTAKLTAWADVGNVGDLEEGDTVRLEGVWVDSYQGNWAVEVQHNSEVEFGVDVDTTAEITGFVQKIGSNDDKEGLIERCPECGRKLNDGTCYEHGEIPVDERERDLRMKVVISDGEDTETVYFGTEATSDILGVTLEEAKQRAADAMSTDVLTRDIYEALLGEEIHVEGIRNNAGLFVNEYDIGHAMSAEQRAKALAE